VDGVTTTCLSGQELSLMRAQAAAQQGAGPD
jgi:hypothetical protein